MIAYFYVVAIQTWGLFYSALLPNINLYVSNESVKKLNLKLKKWHQLQSRSHGERLAIEIQVVGRLMGRLIISCNYQLPLPNYQFLMGLLNCLSTPYSRAKHIERNPYSSYL